MPTPITGNGQQQILSEISLDRRNSNLSRHSKTTNVDDGPSRTISFKLDTAMSFGYDSELGFNSEATGASLRQSSQQSMTGIALRLMLQLSDHELLELWHRCIDARPEMKSWFHKISEAQISEHEKFHSGPLGKAEQLAIDDFSGDLASGVDPPTAEEMTHKSQEIRRNRTSFLEDTQGLLMFGAPQFYCTEDEGKCEVEVIRVGDASEECSVHVTTNDASAKEGEQYEKVDRELRFEVGSKSIRLPIAIKPSTRWNNVLEFKCRLSDPKGAELRENQRGCRVKIIDKHVFPTGRCKDVSKVLLERLFVEYCKMNFSHRVDYSRRSFMVDRFENVVRTYNTAHAELEGVQMNNKEFSSVMASVIIGCYVFVGGASVVFDGLLVGVFLSNLRVLQAVGEVWKSVYEHFLKINSAFFHLQQLAWILHLPDENEQKMVLSRAHQSKGREQRKECRVALDKMLAEGRNCKGIIAIDMIPLCMEDIKLRQGNDGGAHVVSFSWPTFSVQQGRCVCITGRAGCGKATFLRLLAGVNIPLEGEVMVPPHLTVRHISLSPILFKGTLMENLLYGLDKDSPLAKIDRVVSICKQLGLSHRTCSHITDETVNDWEKVCPGTEVRLMHIARGLVSDPEVLILQCPSRGLPFSLSNRVFLLLRVLIEERGIGRDPAGIHKRRPRSVIYSTSPSDEIGIATADELFLLDKASVIALTPEDVTAHWFKTLGHSEVE